MKLEPKWIKARSDLWNPCDGGGCQRPILRGHWYYRAGQGFRLCEKCAAGSTWTEGGGVPVVIGHPPRG